MLRALREPSSTVRKPLIRSYAQFQSVPSFRQELVTLRARVCAYVGKPHALLRKSHARLIYSRIIFGDLILIEITTAPRSFLMLLFILS